MFLPERSTMAICCNDSRTFLLMSMSITLFLLAMKCANLECKCFSFAKKNVLRTVLPFNFDVMKYPCSALRWFATIMQGWFGSSALPLLRWRYTMCIAICAGRLQLVCRIPALGIVTPCYFVDRISFHGIFVAFCIV